MKRYSHLANSNCMACGKWMCVTGGAYTGIVHCPSCKAAHIFENSLSPIRLDAPMDTLAAQFCDEMIGNLRHNVAADKIRRGVA